MTSLPIVPQAPEGARSAPIMALANKLESQFLAEMLKSAGLGEGRQSFGGGTGEAQFSSFLTQAYADATVAAGGIGLSEAIYRALTTREDEA